MKKKIRMHDGIVGTILLSSFALAYVFDVRWLIVIAVIAGLMIISAFTGLCPVYFILNRTMSNDDKTSKEKKNKDEDSKAQNDSDTNNTSKDLDTQEMDLGPGIDELPEIKESIRQKLLAEDSWGIDIPASEHKPAYEEQPPLETAPPPVEEAPSQEPTPAQPVTKETPTIEENPDTQQTPAATDTPGIDETPKVEENPESDKNPNN